MTDLSNTEPLTPAVFHILLALATGEKHGYQIMKQVAHDASGTVRMGNGTLYGSIKRMLAADLIEEATGHSQDDPRRKYYQLTPGGRRALQAEMVRYLETAEVIRSRGFPPSLLPDGIGS